MTYVPKTTAFSHQARIFDETKDLDGYALFWEQGTGKTKPTIDTFCHRLEQGDVDTLLVVAPAGVHLNWVTDELPAHMPDRHLSRALCLAWRSASSTTKWHEKAVEALYRHDGPVVLCIPFDSWITERAKKAAWKLLSKRKVMMVVDEGIQIKNPAAKRSISIIAAGAHAKVRRLLNGTPVANEPWDVYSQIKFVNQQFWYPHELDGYETFKSHFGKWKKIEEKDGRPAFDLCVGYRRLDELQTILKTVSDRVLKEDVLDLPKKLYNKARFDMTPEQLRHYTAIKSEFMTWLDSCDPCEGCKGAGRLECSSVQNEETGLFESYESVCELCNGTGFAKGGLIAAELAIVRMLRFQQITSGYLPTPVGEELSFQHMKENPRLDRMMKGISTMPHSAIIWNRFQEDGRLVCEAIQKAGLTCARYDGTVSEKQRAMNKEMFQKGEAQFFVANPAAIATGVTLNIAKSTIYYSNTFNLIHRLQSEDRNHRIGQDCSVLYTDLIANQSIDEGIVDALRSKVDIAAQVTGDRLKAWI